jgi:hypothetical protein
MRIVDSFPEMPTQLPGGVRPFEYGLLWLLTRREEPQGLGPLRAPFQLGGPRRPPVERHDLGQDLVRIPGSHLALVVERDSQFVKSRHGRLDLAF